MFCTKLKIDFMPSHPECLEATISQQVTIATVLPSNISFVLESAGLRLKSASYFYSAPRMGIKLHADSITKYADYPTDFKLAKINFVSGGEDSFMQWWRYYGAAPMERAITPVGTPYLKFNTQQCVVVCSKNLQGAYLVNAGIPHSVKSGIKPRHCVSYAVTDASSGRYLDYTQAREALQTAGLIEN